MHISPAAKYFVVLDLDISGGDLGDRHTPVRGEEELGHPC